VKVEKRDGDIRSEREARVSREYLEGYIRVKMEMRIGERRSEREARVRSDIRGK
jgi:transcription antitermination factor NusG